VPSGKVKWFNPVKGYGFIKPDDGTPDVVVLLPAVRKAGLATLAEHQALSYDLVPQRGKNTADNLKLG
jgi:cold shock protein